ncbi:DEAD-box type RNA helicase, partial [Coemansia sp. RSA 454]
LVQELIEGKSGCLIAEQRRLLSVITSKPVWQARRVAVSETKPVQINIDEVEAFSAMDNFDLSDVFGDVEIEPSPVAARTMPSQAASTPVSAPKPTYKSDEDIDAVVVVDTPHKRELPKSTRAIVDDDDDDDDIIIVEPHHYPSVAAPRPLRETALAAEPKQEFAHPTEAKSESEPVQEVVFTAADASKAQRKQTYMDHWVSRSKPQSMGQPSLTSQLAARAKATSSASRAASTGKKVGGGVISKMRSSFDQERSTTIPNRMPKIPKQVVKPSRALPSVPTEFWAANRLGGSMYGSYTPTVTSVRDVSQQAMLEHEQEKRRRAKERAARLQESSDVSSSDDDETQQKGGLAGLIDSVKSPMRAPRRTMMMASSNTYAGGNIRTFGGGTTFVDQQARERAVAKQRAKMRLMPSMAALHKHILSWGFDSTGDMPPNFSTDALRKIPDQFEDCNLYTETFEPLFLLECWAQFQRAKEETASSETCVATLKSHMGEDEFYELTFTMLPADAQQLTDGDVLVFAESQSREKQWAQGLSVGGTAPGARFSGKTFLAIVKKRQFGRAGAQVMVRVHFAGAQLAAHMSRLVLGSEWEWFCLFGMTPIHREFAALQSLPYLSENLVREILHPRMSLSYAIDSAEVRSCMKAHSLNQPQAESVVAAMRREHGFTLIQGPPGTGKTKTILGLVGALLSNSKDRAGKSTDTGDKPANKMLVCAPSNAAVDEIVKRLKSGIRDSKGSTFFPRVVRVGQANNVSSTVRDTTLDFLTDKAMDARGTAARDPNVSVGQSELLLDIAARTQASRTVANAKGTQKAAQGLLRTLMKSLDEVNAEIRELDNQMQTVDPSNTALLSGIREKFRKVKSRKSKLYHELDQERARAREAARTMDETRQAVRMQILQSTDVLCCTLSGSGHEMLASLKCTFDTVIIDEAAQSIELACLIPLKYECERCILVGDPKQLPPTVFSLPATQRLYNQSLFVRIQRNAPDAVNLLSIQYRMHPEISALPSRLFYDSRLRDGPDMRTKQHAVWHNSERYRPYVFFDIVQGREQSGASHSVFNMDEVNAAIQL